MAHVLRACGERQDECASRGGDEPVRQQVEAKARQTAADTQRYTGISLTMLQTLATSLGRFPGAKHVFVFSEGFYTGEQRQWMANVTAQAARNNVHFSTFDARGLNRDSRSQGFMADGPLQTAGDLSAYTLDDNADVLTSLAIDTGGAKPRGSLVALRGRLEREQRKLFKLDADRDFGRSRASSCHSESPSLGSG